MWLSGRAWKSRRADLPGKSMNRASTSAGHTVQGETSGCAAAVLHWMFINRRHGRVTIAQWPNVPLAAFLLISAASRIFHPSGGTGTLVRALGLVALSGWALDELMRGVNPFRRILGGAVLAATWRIWVFIDHGATRRRRCRVAVAVQPEVISGASASSEFKADWLVLFSRRLRMRHASQRSNNFDPK